MRMKKNKINLNEGNGWVKQGLFLGLIMYVLTTFMFPLITGQKITLGKVLIGIPIWTIGGLGFGYIMKLINGINKPKRETN
jgi:hypothetical protein